MKKKIFILDDNQELLEIMFRLLNQEYQVHCTGETNNIVNEIIDFTPDVLVLDHSIGETNSGDIISKLKATHPSFKTPVVLFSAHPKLSEIAEVLGVQGYIDKPCNIAHIRSYIKEILESNTVSN